MDTSSPEVAGERLSGHGDGVGEGGRKARRGAGGPRPPPAGLVRTSECLPGAWGSPRVSAPPSLVLGCGQLSQGLVLSCRTWGGQLSSSLCADLLGILKRFFRACRLKDLLPDTPAIREEHR